MNYLVRLPNLVIVLSICNMYYELIEQQRRIQLTITDLWNRKQYDSSGEYDMYLQ